MAGWNKPSAANQPMEKKGGAKSPSLMKGVIVGAVAVVVGVVCIFMFSGKSEKPVKDTGTKPAKIKEVTPAKAQTNNVTGVEGTQGGVDKEEKPKLTRKQLRDLANGRNWYPPAHTSNVQHIRREAKLFKSSAEQVLVSILLMEPGEMMVGDPADLFNERYRKHLTDAMINKIEIGPNDSEEDKQIKQMVIDAKKELLAYAKQGGDPCQMLIDTCKEMQNLGVYKHELELELKKAIRNGDMSDEDVEDLRTAANKLLESRGISAIKMPGVFKHRMKILAKKQEKQAQKENKK